MLKAVKFLSPLLLIFLMIGCSSDSNLNVMDSSADQPTVALAAAARIVPGGTINSATLYLNVDEASGQRIDVHRVTAPWDENTVTWNSFGSSFVPDIETSFMADVMGWKAIDITGLVQGWIDGDYPNYGFVLRQIELNHPRTIFWSSEGYYPPYLEICYDENGAEMCEQLDPLGDVFISEYWPDSNLNVSINEVLFTGAYNDVDLTKMSLMQFDLPTTPPPDDGGCTRTKGYWKTHAGIGHGNQDDMVTPLLPIWLGDSDGPRALYVDNAQMAVDILKMKTYGRPSNGITKLYAQLLAAKLNIANGASDVDAAGAIAKADRLLGRRNWHAWRRLSAVRKARVLTWMTTLDAYNNGIIGPGHCDDGGDDDDGGCGGRWWDRNRHHDRDHDRDRDHHRGRGHGCGGGGGH